MSENTIDRYRNAALVTFGAYAIGLLTRRGWDSINHFPTIAEQPLIDIDLIVYGVIFIFNLLWCNITINTIYDVKLLTKSRASWDKFNASGKEKGRKIYIALYMVLHAPFAFYLLILVPAFMSIALSGGLNREFVYTLASWVLLLFFVFLGFYRSLHGTSHEPDTIENMLADTVGADGYWSKKVVLIVFVALFQGVTQYPRIPQSFGGGKPEQVIVFLKKGNSLLLPSQTDINGQMVDLVFKRGSKYGFKTHKWRNDHIVIIDQDLIASIYAGSGIKQIDPQKLAPR